ncbi:hypothetical protein J3R82DRAFT_10622, partial [Butyriboletus roseoflavus]
ADLLIASLKLDRVGVFDPKHLVPVVGAREDGTAGFRPSNVSRPPNAICRVIWTSRIRPVFGDANSRIAVIQTR